MNRIEFNLFIKKTFGAKYNQGRQEWRLMNGDRIYTLDASFETNRSTYEQHLSKVRMFEHADMVGGPASEDIKGSASFKYSFVGEIEQDRLTLEELRAWIVKAMITYEFE
jgi:hypothetical protein